MAQGLAFRASHKPQAPAGQSLVPPSHELPALPLGGTADPAVQVGENVHALLSGLGSPGRGAAPPPLVLLLLLDESLVAELDVVVRQQGRDAHLAVLFHQLPDGEEGRPHPLARVPRSPPCRCGRAPRSSRPSRSSCSTGAGPSPPFSRAPPPALSRTPLPTPVSRYPASSSSPCSRPRRLV